MGCVYDATVKDEATAREGAAETTRPAPFETLRYDPTAVAAAGEARGFVRLKRHLARLERSSAWLGRPLDREAVVSALRSAVAGRRGAQRVRVTIADDGAVEVGVTALAMERFDDTPADALASAAARLAAGTALPRAALARQRVDETDPARAHKTTSRELYYAGRAVAERLGLDDVLFLDSQGRLAEGSISSVFLVSDGGSGRVVITPPLSTGALPGVLREELVDHGLVQEREAGEPDLRRADAVLLGSSVRGLRRVTVVPELVAVA